MDPFADPLGHLLGVVTEAVVSIWQADSPATSNRHSGIADLLRIIDTHPDALQFDASTREALRRRLMALDRLDFLSRPR